MRHFAPLFAVAAIVAPFVAQAADHTVFFAHDSARLTSEGRATLAQAASEYAASGETSVSVVGHTDTSGSADYNYALSERRARAVADALVAAGVPASSMTAAWRGETEPAVASGDNVREPANRRVEISISAPAAAAPETTVEQVLLGLRVGLGPYVGFNMEDGDESTFLGANLTIAYDITPNIAVSAEQAVFYSIDSSDEGWGGRSALGLDYSFTGMGSITPYVGVNGGYMYVDGTATGGFFGGPEIGVRSGPFEVKAAYDFVEDRDAEDGVISLTGSYYFSF